MPRGRGPPNARHRRGSRDSPSPDPDVDELADALDWAALQVLRELEGVDDGLTTTDLREATGLGNKRVAHRRERLTDLDLVEVEDAEEYPDHYPHPPKVHSLTEKGEVALSRGLLAAGPAPVPDDFEEIASLVQSLHNDLRSVERTSDQAAERANDNWGEVKQLKRSVRELAERVEDLGDRLDDHDERLEQKRDKSRFSLR
jgi:hypothetical protein